MTRYPRTTLYPRMRPPPPPADGPLYVVQDGVKVYGKFDALYPLGLTIVLYTTAVVQIEGYSAETLAKVSFALDGEVFTEEDDCIYLSVRNPDGFVKENTFFLWAGKKDAAPAPAGAPLEDTITGTDEDVLEQEIQVITHDYANNAPCRPTFTLTAFPAIAEGMTYAVILDGGEPEAIPGDSYAPTVSGVNDFYFVNNEDAVESGRAVNPIDIEGMARVCLIGGDLVETFFYGVNPIGETIYLNNMRFTVVGVTAENSDASVASILAGSPDVYMPYTTALKMNGQSLLPGITVYMDDADASAQVQSALEDYLDALFSYEDDTYTITTMDSIESTMDSMLSMMSALLEGIASIALVVGGIGIMNMMLTSVTERTVEIGLKKAIGAEPGQIQIQFLIESFLLSMIGGLAGVGLGLVLSAVMCSVMGTRFTISYGAIGLGVGFSAAVGIIFGWSPARKASKLSPIDALRRM